MSYSRPACGYHTSRCGRLHCFITGPLYFSAALVSFVAGLGLTPISWSWIALGALTGTLLAHVPEWVHG